MNSWEHIPLSKAEVLAALEQALANTFIDNLRNRHPNVALDSRLRGYVGEIAFKKWLKQNQITEIESNQMDHKSSMDIDFLVQRNGKKLALELKTSLIPDADETFAEVARKRDIKLIKRGSAAIEDLKGDIHVQMFFKQLRIRKDEWLKTRPIFTGASAPCPSGRRALSTLKIEAIYQQLAAFRYENDTYLAAWIDKPTLIKQIKQKPPYRRKWKYGKREFWCCNLEKETKPIDELVEYLKE